MSDYVKAKVNLEQAQAALRLLSASLGAELPTRRPAPAEPPRPSGGPEEGLACAVCRPCS